MVAVSFTILFACYLLGVFSVKRSLKIEGVEKFDFGSTQKKRMSVVVLLCVVSILLVILLHIQYLWMVVSVILPIVLTLAFLNIYPRYTNRTAKRYYGFALILQAIGWSSFSILIGIRFGFGV